MPGEDDLKAFQRFLPQTSQVRRVRPLREDPAIFAKNVARGVEAVLRHEIEIRRELPGVDVKALRELPHLARAVAFAAKTLEASSPRKNDLRPLLKRARELRELLLSSASSLVAAELLPAAAVAKIRSGLGVADSATDCLKLAALFREHAVDVKGKSPVSRAVLDEAEKVGNEILAGLAAARTTRSNGTSVTPAMRDKLWSLLIDRHDTLWRVGAYFYGRDVDRHVPSLVASKR